MHRLQTSILALLLLLVLFMPERLEAQVLRSYGAKVAVTSTDISYEFEDPRLRGASPDFERRTGVNVALFAEWLTYPYLSLLTQAEYTQRGFAPVFLRAVPVPDNPGYLTSEEVTANTRLDYLSAFVPLKVQYPVGTFLTPFILAGPRLDVLLNQHVGTVDLDGFGPSGFRLRDPNRTQLGLSTGAGITVGDLGKLSLTLEARYNLDLTDATSSSSVEVKHNAFDVWFGISL